MEKNVASKPQDIYFTEKIDLDVNDQEIEEICNNVCVMIRTNIEEWLKEGSV